MAISVTRLSGGLTPADGSDPRTFPAIWNGTADTIESIALEVYPVGAIYLSVVSTNPGTLFGGTWAAFGEGRVLVGLDATDADFDTVEETGGAKTHSHTTPSHVHSSASHNHNLPIGWDGGNVYYGMLGTTAGDDIPIYGSDVPTNPRGADAPQPWEPVTDNAWRRARSEGTTPGNTGGATPTTNTSSSVQPYITVYMWKRTA